MPATNYGTTVPDQLTVSRPRAGPGGGPPRVPPPAPASADSRVRKFLELAGQRASVREARNETVRRRGAGVRVRACRAGSPDGRRRGPGGIGGPVPARRPGGRERRDAVTNAEAVWLTDRAPGAAPAAADGPAGPARAGRRDAGTVTELPVTTWPRPADQRAVGAAGTRLQQRLGPHQGPARHRRGGGQRRRLRPPARGPGDPHRPDRRGRRGLHSAR